VAVTGQKRPSHLHRVVVALGVCVVIGVLINFFLLQSRPPGVLDGPVVAQDIAQSIQFTTHVATAPTVRCPRQEPERRGTAFSCRLQPAPGAVPVPVTVSVTDDHGDFTFRVGASSRS
jgi:hypothetical protein